MTDQPSESTAAPTDRVTLAEAATILGISREAVRLRLRRGTLVGERVGGVWYVSLVGWSQAGPVVQRPTKTDRPSRPPRPPRRDELVAELRDRVSFLERLVEHQAGVIADLVRRPELPPGEVAPAEKPTQFVEEVSQASPATATRRRSWWRRLLGQS